MVTIDSEFIRQWSREYDAGAAGTDDERTESSIRGWLQALPEPKYLDRPRFLAVCTWKSPRPRRLYENNTSEAIEEATRLAYSVTNCRLKLGLLTALHGVNVPVAATILHFLLPDEFPIFDVRARTTLKKAGKWPRKETDASLNAWEDYVKVMRGIAFECGASLREVDKALYKYDKDKKRLSRGEGGPG